MTVLPLQNGVPMNTDPKKSAQACGCDEGANHPCETHRKWPQEAWQQQWAQDHQAADTDAPFSHPINQKVWRKERPLYSGVLAYFPDALLEVAHVSFLGNKQHNPGQPLHWAREKSTDHLDCIVRHVTDHAVNPIDTDGALHLAKAAWRALAELQLFLEKERKDRP